MLGPHILAALNGTDITPEIEELILEHRILGFTLFKRNIQSASQVQKLTSDLQAIAKKANYQLLLAVDQEGGRVARLSQPEFVKIPPMQKWAERFIDNNQAEDLFELGVMLAEQTLSCGFNVDFAPVVDVNTISENPVIGDRSFGSDPQLVYVCARNVLRGMRKGGVISCIKHFPGHGATTKDSHLDLPIDDRYESEILASDVFPFQKLMAESLVDSVMTAHVLYPSIDKNKPATVSQTIITNILRQDLNYQGVVFSDDMMMKAISDHYGIEKAVFDFFKAGGDAVLICEKPELTLDILENFPEKEASLLTHQLEIAKNRLEMLKRRMIQPDENNHKNTFAHLVKRHQMIIDNFFG